MAAHRRKVHTSTARIGNGKLLGEIPAITRLDRPSDSCAATNRSFRRETRPNDNPRSGVMRAEDVGRDGLGRVDEIGPPVHWRIERAPLQHRYYLLARELEV
jgi:hypothetical protein